MAVNMKPASADTVRAWAAEEGWTDQYGRPPKDRGRLNSELVADFDKAHKRNRVHYVPGYKDDNSNPAQTQGNGGNARSTSRSSEVATRPASRSTAPARQTSAKASDEKATSRRSRSSDDDSPVRVQAERVSADVAASMPVERINIEDAIALLTSAAAARKKGDAPPALIAVYTLV